MVPSFSSEVLLLSLTAQTPAGFDHRPQETKFTGNQKPVTCWFFRESGLTSTTGLTTLDGQGRPVGGICVPHKASSEITQRLQEWRDGDRKALDSLLPLVYKELRRLAHFQLRNERPDHTMHSSALVHEAYLRLVGMNAPRWESRTHFFAIATQLTGQILVDYARRHRAAKRGGSVCKVSLEDALIARQTDVDVIALDDALQALAKIDERQRIVELRFFAGLSLAEISVALDVGPATVQRDWTAGRAWLHREISGKSRA
jgi:RNA polymerase sigma factor (TIGR02999 family)